MGTVSFRLYVKHWDSAKLKVVDSVSFRLYVKHWDSAKLKVVDGKER